MATVYYSCDGSVTAGNVSNSQALTCSTGWQTYTPPTNQPLQAELSGELLTAADTSSLIAAVMVLVALWAAFKIILNTMGIKL
ncbi:MAG: hypothetical protein IPP76_06385 [Moraxellaceae bacterium]|nr:hypothetical protein [Moraxellaceae bacterium]